MTSNRPQPPSEWIVKVIVPIVVALIGVGAGAFQYFRTTSPSCQIMTSEISLEKSVIYTNDTIKVSVRANNPKGEPMLYNWQAVYGKMEPNVRSSSSESTYVAPLEVVDDTISVDVTLPDCESARKSRAISVIFRR